MKVVIVSATRASTGEFEKQTALGGSVQRLAHDSRFGAHVVTSNKRGLPLVYNEAIDSFDDDAILIFLHDDVWIDDYFLIQRVIEGLQQFDVIGLVGNRRRLPEQPSWGFATPDLKWDDGEHFTGSIGQGSQAAGPVHSFGPAPAECEILDGVFLAAKRSTLIQRGVRFDPRFEFHFYDMDFCRSARQAGLRLGTWPICVTHQSIGKFGGPDWRSAFNAYLAKWGA
jgi:GT2 family glycosyltransferase